ncbi:MAG TPA: DsrE family protein [Gammaproteobacteria bacterium]|nr:DsrE family protein [Gammaproteobacteria bacterium]
MAKYLFIESRDPFTSKETENDYEMAVRLAHAGNTVTLFLVQNGVLPARRESAPDRIAKIAANGVEILGDEFSLRERGIAREELADGVTPAGLEVVVDQLAQGTKTVWL